MPNMNPTTQLSSQPGVLVEDKARAEENPNNAPPSNITYPAPLVAAVLVLALLLALLLVALDMSIIATAIPIITAEFHSVDQIGWYGSAFFLCLAAFQSFWGKMFKYYPLKFGILACVAVFEIGSLLAALSPNSTALIFGRAIQGVGGAGVSGGVYTILAFITRPQHLPAIFGLSSAVWSLSSVLGPVLGGLFTQYASWRWCFWVNLPIGGATFLIILFVFETPPHSRLAHATLRDLPNLFDLLGISLLIGGLTCLLLTLEGGGVNIPWGSSRSIGLLIGFVFISALFAIWEWKQGESAMIVPRIMKRRSIVTLALFNLTAQGAGFARTYLLPIYFQAAQGASPSESGIRTLPTVLTTSIFSLFGSILLGKVGYYQPFLVVGAVFTTVGTGMLYTLEPLSTAGPYIGYQVLAGIGSGLVIQVNVIVAQAISSRVDMSTTVAMVLFWQFIAGTIGVSTSQNIMDNLILSNLFKKSPEISPGAVIEAGAAGLRGAFPNPNDLADVVSAYMHGIKGAWIFGIVLSGLSLAVAFGSEWKSIRADDVRKRNESKAAAATVGA